MTSRPATRRYFTPPEVAADLGVNESKILGWIRRGELRAVNLASRANGRPRWRISQDDLDAFLQRRSTSPAPEVTRRRRRRMELQVVKFF